MRCQALEWFTDDWRREMVENTIISTEPKHEKMNVSKENAGEKTKDAALALPGEVKRTMFEWLNHFHQEPNPHFKAKDQTQMTFTVI